MTHTATNSQPAIVDRTKAPEVHQFGMLRIPREEIVLDQKGVRLHILRNGSWPINRIEILSNYGTSRLPYMRKQLASGIAAALMLEGTPEMSGDEIADRVDFEGAHLKCTAGAYGTTLSLVSLSSSTLKLLPVIAGIWKEISPRHEIFQTILAQQANQRMLELEKVSERASIACMEQINGPSHPYLRTVSPTDFRDVTMDDVMEAYTNMTRHSRIDVFLAGNPGKEIEEAVLNLCHQIGDNNSAQDLLLPVTPYQPETPERRDVAVPGAVQGAIRMGIPVEISRSHPDYIPLRLTVMALGGYFGSRLMTNLREQQGLTYGVSASLQGVPEGTIVDIRAQCAEQNIDIVLNGIIAEIKQLASENISEAELSQLRAYATSSLVSVLDSPFQIMDYHALHYTLGTPKGYFEKQMQAILTLKPDTLREMACKYLSGAKEYVGTAGSPL